MKNISFRLVLLTCVLIAAFYYRFPVQIHKFAIESKSRADKLIKQLTFSGKASKESLAVDRSKTANEKIVIITLKNKRQIEGIIQKETTDQLIVDIGIGTVVVSRNDIENIEEAGDREKEKILEEWGGMGKKGGDEGTITEIRYWDPERITVRVTLNDKVKATLILDTGAPYVAVTPAIGEKLAKLNDTVSKGVNMKWTNGSTTPGKLILLESVQIGNAKVKNVEGVISQIPILDPGTDGLLGMSFLRHFHLKIDAATRRVILERR